MPELTISQCDAGTTAGAYLQQRLPGAPPGYLNKLFKKGKILRAGQAIRADELLADGDILQLPQSERMIELLTTAENICKHLEILLETRELVIVNKASGLAVHRSQGHQEENLTDIVKKYYLLKKEEFQVAPVQRLDLETSGPVIFGKGKKSCSEMGKLMMAGGISKSYLALVARQPPVQGELQSTMPAKGKIKQALCSYIRLAGNEQASLLQINLETGRQHQIRRQFAEHGHPLYGDRRYHGPCPQQLPRLFLHCCELSFRDPFTREERRIKVPLPKELAAFCSLLGIAAPG